MNDVGWRQDRLASALLTLRSDALVTANPAIIRMATGVAPALETPFGPFRTPPTLVASLDRPPVLVCADGQQPVGVETVTYVGIGTTPFDERAPRRALAEALGRGMNQRVLVDVASVPLSWSEPLRSAQAIGSELWTLTGVKSDGDVAAIARASESADAAQAVARLISAQGARPSEILSAARQVIGSHSNDVGLLIADVLTEPSEVDTPLAPGASVLCDFAPRRDGMWADSAATWVVGEPPSTLQTDLHAIASESLLVGVSMLRAGNRAGDVDMAMRQTLRTYGYECRHHMGHGVGYSWHDAPRIIPDSNDVLEPGMVVALEPGVYIEGFSVRIEQVFVVTDAQPRLLSGHRIDLWSDERSSYSAV